MLTYAHSFHNKLKTNPRYLAHQINRRVDDLICTLLILEEDLFFDQKHKEIMRDPTDASLQYEGMQRHEQGTKIENSSVKVCTPEGAVIHTIY